MKIATLAFAVAVVLAAACGSSGGSSFENRYSVADAKAAVTHAGLAVTASNEEAGLGMTISEGLNFTLNGNVQIEVYRFNTAANLDQGAEMLREISNCVTIVGNLVAAAYGADCASPTAIQALAVIAALAAPD